MTCTNGRHVVTRVHTWHDVAMTWKMTWTRFMTWISDYTRFQIDLEPVDVIFPRGMTWPIENGDVAAIL